MQTEFRREDLGGGVGLITVTDPKFKTNCINVRFLTAFSKDKAPALALLSQVLSSLSADYPDSALMSRKLNSLYGSWVSGYSSQRGGIYEVSVSANSLCDRYALSGEYFSAAYSAPRLKTALLLRQSSIQENSAF